ncbi:conserved hypothetical protein, partial [Ricinus communis]
RNSPDIQGLASHKPTTDRYGRDPKSQEHHMQDKEQHLKGRATIAQKHLQGLGMNLKRHDALALAAKMDGYRNYVSAIRGKQHGSSGTRPAPQTARTFRAGFERDVVVADYLAAGGQHCPSCASRNIADCMNSSLEASQWEFLMGCTDCGHKWWALYRLASRDGIGLHTPTAASALRAAQEHSGEPCPYCGTEGELKYGDVVLGSRAYQHVRCMKCLLVWLDIWELTDAARTEDGSNVIVENGEQLEITEPQEHVLLAAD